MHFLTSKWNCSWHLLQWSQCREGPLAANHPVCDSTGQEAPGSEQAGATPCLTTCWAVALRSCFNFCFCWSEESERP